MKKTNILLVIISLLGIPLSIRFLNDDAKSVSISIFTGTLVTGINSLIDSYLEKKKNAKKRTNLRNCHLNKIREFFKLLGESIDKDFVFNEINKSLTLMQKTIDGLNDQFEINSKEKSISSIINFNFQLIEDSIEFIKYNESFLLYNKIFTYDEIRSIVSLKDLKFRTGVTNLLIKFEFIKSEFEFLNRTIDDFFIDFK